MKTGAMSFDKFSQEQIDIFLSEHNKIVQLENSNKNNKAEIYNRYAKNYEKIGLIKNAILNYENAVLEFPSSIEYNMDLIKLFQKLSLYYSEKKILKSLLSYYPENEDLNYLLEGLNKIACEKTVTFYIPCFNQEKYIEETIKNILAQSYPIDELLVIDDGSTDNSIEIAGNYPVKIIKHETNKGLAAARNTALINSNSELLASLDVDAVPDRYWLEYLVLAFNEENIAGINGKMIEKYTLTAVDKWRQIRMRQNHGESEFENVLLYGCNTVFRVNILRKLGGYNEQLRTNFEDMDISQRILKNGFKTKYIPYAICRHLKIDNLQSAVDTCYNWRKSVFELDGAFKSIDKLKEKSKIGINENIQDCNQLLANSQFEVLYPNFLGIFRTVFKDLDYYNRNNENQGKENLKAVFLIMNYILRNSASSIEFLKFMNIDLLDLIGTIKDDAFIIKIMKALNDDCFYRASIEEMLDKYLEKDKINMEYVSSILDHWKAIVKIEPLVFKMLEISRKRISYEEENDPYNFKERILICNPPWLKENRVGVRAGSRWPFTYVKNGRMSYIPFPFFLAHLSSYLKDNGLPNVTIDGVAEELTNEEFFEKAFGYAPQIIVMEIATASYITDNMWLLKLKEELPDLKVIWTGSHVSALGNEIIKTNSFIDFVINGEYERTATELIKCLIEKQDYTNLKGLIFKDQSGKIINNGQSDVVANLDDLPLPERITLPLYKYVDLFAGMQYPSLQMHSSRGCPYGCIYCIWPQVLYGNKKYRTRSPRKVVDEVEFLIKEYGFKSFYFDDDTFNIGKRRVLQICDELISRGINIPWGAMARADTTDFETLKRMKDAGLIGIKFGVESGNQQLVDSAEKNLDLKKVERAVAWCKQLDIKTHLTFTFGLPGETRETVQETMAFAKKLNPDSLQFSITTPFPGTKYFNVLKEKNNLISEEWEKYDGCQFNVIKSDHLGNEELSKILEFANNEWWEFKSK